MIVQTLMNAIIVPTHVGVNRKRREENSRKKRLSPRTWG